jgi:filamentous hemagglutinin
MNLYAFTNHLAGIDFSQPVDIVPLLQDTTVVQYGAPGSATGNYFAPIGTPASQLGINPAGKVPSLFAPSTDVVVLRSTAADIVDTWSVPSDPYSASGGATQYFTKTPEVFMKVTK